MKKKKNYEIMNDFSMRTSNLPSVENQFNRAFNPMHVFVSI